MRVTGAPRTALTHETFCRMRMKNVGRQTITSSGPNSFGKTKGGFTDHNAMLERQLKAAMDEVSNDNSAETVAPPVMSEYGS